MTDWTPKLFWHLHDPLNDDPSIPTWELVAEIADHRFGLATVWQEKKGGIWHWCIQDTETCGQDESAHSCVGWIRLSLPKWATVIPAFPVVS